MTLASETRSTVNGIAARRPRAVGPGTPPESLPTLPSTTPEPAPGTDHTRLTRPADRSSRRPSRSRDTAGAGARPGARSGKSGAGLKAALFALVSSGFQGIPGQCALHYFLCVEQVTSICRFPWLSGIPGRKRHGPSESYEWRASRQ